MSTEKTSKELALSSCHHLNNCPYENPCRSDFFIFFNKNGYGKATEKYILKKENKIEKIKDYVTRIVNHQIPITSDLQRKAITSYYSFFNQKITFVEKISELFKIPLCYGKNKVLASANSIVREVAHRMKIKTCIPQTNFPIAERNTALIDALLLLAQKEIPVYFYNRVGKEEKGFAYSTSAQRRMELGLSFPKMYKNIDKYEDEFKELFSDLYSKEYVNKIGKIPQSIKKGDNYCHEDCSSEYINIIQGKRITCYQPNQSMRTIHIY